MSDTTKETGEAPAAENGAKAPLRLLKKDAFLKRDDRKYRDVPVPEWEEDGVVPIVRLQSLSGTEREEFETSITKTKADGTSSTDMKGARAKLLVKIIVDEEGRRIFDDSDVGALSQKSAAAIGRLFDEGSSLSGILKRDVEEAVKN